MSLNFSFLKNKNIRAYPKVYVCTPLPPGFDQYKSEFNHHRPAFDVFTLSAAQNLLTLTADDGKPQ